MKKAFTIIVLTLILILCYTLFITYKSNNKYNQQRKEIQDKYKRLEIEKDSLIMAHNLLKKEIQEVWQERDLINIELSKYKRNFSTIKRKYDEIRINVNDMSIDDRIQFFTELISSVDDSAGR